MTTNGQMFINLFKKGRLSLKEVRHLFDQTGYGTVSVENWEASYSGDSLEMSEYCEITQSAGGPAIAAVGLLAYSSDGETLYGAQYTAGFNSLNVFASVSTGLPEPADDGAILGVLFGFTTDGTNFFFEQSLAVTPVQLEAGA